MEILLLMFQTIPVTIAILQLLNAILVQIQPNVIIIFLSKKNKLILFFFIGLSCNNPNYLKNDFT